MTTGTFGPSAEMARASPSRLSARAPLTNTTAPAGDRICPTACENAPAARSGLAVLASQLAATEPIRPRKANTTEACPIENCWGVELAFILAMNAPSNVIRSVGGTDIGRRRQANEDSFLHD